MICQKDDPTEWVEHLDDEGRLLLSGRSTNEGLQSIALIVEGPITQLSITNLLGFIYLGLIGTGVAYALWFRGIDQLKPSVVSYLGLLSPVVATLIGFVVLHQTFTSLQWTGIAIVLVSILLGQHTTRLRHRRINSRARRT
ncbi:EamA family transporter [Cyanobacteria bacterium FACHB-63]|nr:EamA family transporter [Cyanobacteria bacterium FACHB-63]